MKEVEAEEVKAWIIKNQFGRRNLTYYERSELALKLEGLYKKKAKENQKLSKGRGNKGKDEKGLLNSTNLKEDEIDKPINTREELADEAGVSANTIKC